MRQRTSSFSLMVKGESALKKCKPTNVSGKEPTFKLPQSFSMSNCSRSNVRIKEDKVEMKKKPQQDDTSSLITEETDEIKKEEFYNLLIGQLENLPNLPKSIVRIFLSSTFKDTQIERNALMVDVYPKIQEFCANHGLDFQVVDMRWGIPEDTQADYSTEELCLYEIENCQNLSLGPNFVAFIGSRYGYRPLPQTIDVCVFNYILLEAKEKATKNCDLLKNWYIKDTNAIPPVYTLQPVRNVYPNYMSRNPNMKEQSEKAALAWQQCEAKLKFVLRKAATSAYHNKSLTKEQSHRFHLSVTETEVTKGVLNVKNAESKSLVYLRKFSNFPDSLDGDDLNNGSGEEMNMVDDSPTLYVDYVTFNKKKQIDEEAKSLLEDFTNKVESQPVGKTSYNVPWLSGGIDLGEYHEPHVDYINNFCKDFYEHVIQLIEKAIDTRKRRVKGYHSTFDEILHHLHFCEKKCALFCGQENTLTRVKNILQNGKLRKPVVIFANSGVGKTSLLAMVMKRLVTWFPDGYVAVIRFLGTSPETCNIFDMLLSVIWHVADLCGVIIEPMGCDNTYNLRKYFPRFLRQAGNQLKKPLIILLDSLDQLFPECDAFDWLPNVLPSNVHVIVSTLPDKKIMSQLKGVLHHDCFVEVPLMSDATGEEIITKFLQQRNRSITNSQKRELLSKFSKVSSPLYLNILLQSALKWSSYTEIDSDRIPDSIPSAIDQFFADLEGKFGKKLVNYALGYVTISLNGLTELELIDALSCNNEVLNAVYEKNDPPSRKIINLPPLLWARIYLELKEYLTERLSHGKTTFYWYHRQFIEAAHSRYTKNVEELHADLFEIFTCETSIKKDLTLRHRNWIIYDADRNVTPQQLHTDNKRQLECVTYHLCKSGDSIPTKYAREKVFCNIHFLFTKIITFSKEKVINEMQDYVSKKPDPEVEEVLQLLTHIDEEITSELRLAVIFLANLPLTNEGSSLFNLRQESQRIVEASTTSMLIPTYNCLRQKRECVRSRLLMFLKGYEKVLINKEGVILLKRTRNHTSPFAALYTTAGCQFTYLGAREFSTLLPMTDGRDVYVMSTDRVGFLDTTNMRTIRWQNDDTMKNCSGRPLKVSWPNYSSHLAVVFDSSQLSLFAIKDQKLRPVSSFKIDSSSRHINDIKLCYFDSKPSIILASSTGDLTVYTKIDRCNPSTQKKKFSSPIISLNLCNDNDIIVVQVGDKLISLRLETLEILEKLKVKQQLLNLQVHPHQALVAILENTENIHILSPLNFSLFNVVSICDYKICCFTVNWNTNIIFIGEQNGRLLLYNYVKKTLMQTLDTNQSALTSVTINTDFVATIDSNATLKLWDFPQENLLKNEQNITKENLPEDSIISFAFLSDGATLMTGSQQKYIKVWDINGSLLKSSTIAVRPQQLHLLDDKYIIAYEKSLGMLEIYNAVNFDCVMNFRGMYILAMTVQKDANDALLYTINDYTDYMGIAITNIYQKKVLMVIPIIKQFEFTSLEVYLTDLSSYLVFKCGITNSDYKEIESSWKNKGQFHPQPHPYRFAAIKIDCQTGVLQQCYRQLTDIPTLGQTLCLLQNNLIMIAARGYVLLWDIPTGKCDQAITKTVYRKAKFMRADWTKNCTGTSTVMVRSPNHKFIVIGSEDGYVFIYRTDNGMPIQMKAPDTKHEAAICQIAVSPDNKWVSSSCVNNFLKLWSADNNQELFSIQLRSQAVNLLFTPNSTHLAVCTQENNVCIFKVHKGKDT